jgi:CheY-like chemotaxis protein
MGRHILIADPDLQTARQLAPLLRHRGYQVSVVKNGPRALEICVLRAPDLVLLDEACPLLDAQTFRQIVRANPHTEQLPILVTGTAEVAAPLTLLDGFLLKPFNVDEVLARIEQIFRRVEAARQTRRGDQRMEGTLGQLAVTDLLQVLGQNHKSGLLELSGPHGAARVRLHGGQVAEAQAEGVGGIKALFRLLHWKDGMFSFVPSECVDPGDINRSVEELLLEGLRQTDELPALRTELPDPATHIGMTQAGVELSGDQHPVTAEILELGRAGGTVGEILERSRATDYSAAQALLTLLRKGLLAPTPGVPGARREQRPLLWPGGVHALRARMQLGRVEGGRIRGKLLLAAVDAAMLPPFIERLGSLPECKLDADAISDALEIQFGSLGRIDASEDLSFDLLLVPLDESSAPLWQPFSARALGAIVLVRPSMPAAGVAQLVDFLAREQELPVAFPGLTELPAELAQFAPHAVPAPAAPGEVLRELLALAARVRPRPVS